MKVQVTRYCRNCERTTKQELTMRGPGHIVGARCLKCGKTDERMKDE